MALLRRTVAIWLCVLGLVVWLHVLDGYSIAQIIDRPDVLLPCRSGCSIVR